MALAEITTRGFITLFLLTFIIILLSLSSICIGHSNAVTEQQHTSITTPVVIVPTIMQNLLTLICFLFLACLFVLGLRIQSAAGTTTGSKSQSSSCPSHRSVIDEYFLLLILSSLVPALIVTVYGIVLIYAYLSGSLHATFGNHVYVSYVEGNYSYLLLLFVCFIPAGALAFTQKVTLIRQQKLDWGFSRSFKR